MSEIIVYYIKKVDNVYVIYTMDIRYSNREGLTKRHLKKEDIGNAIEEITNILRQLNVEVLFKWM